MCPNLSPIGHRPPFGWDGNHHYTEVIPIFFSLANCPGLISTVTDAQLCAGPFQQLGKFTPTKRSCTPAGTMRSARCVWERHTSAARNDMKRNDEHRFGAAIWYIVERRTSSTNLTRRNGFFKHPCKHYPLKDTYVAAVPCTEANRADKEDDPNGDLPGGDEVDLTAVDAQDAADAEAVLTQLMRQQLPADDQDGATTTARTTEAAKQLMQEISALLSNFNQSIQDEAKDRKYRFVVKRLMKEHQRAGDTLDEELDFYRDDDDVAVLFTMCSSS